MQLNIHVSQIIKISSKTANHEIAFIAFPGYKKTVVLNDSSQTTHAFVLFSKWRQRRYQKEKQFSLDSQWNMTRNEQLNESKHHKRCLRPCPDIMPLKWPFDQRSSSHSMWHPINHFGPMNL